MKFLLVCAVLLVSAFAANYAVLVAGSNGYYNYRHQADVAHAYCVMQQGGIPADNIIVMSYDDVAHSSSNPFPENMINVPNGPNVYDCVKDHIDYKGDDVTPKNFLAVLRGEKSGVHGGNGRVLGSGPEDNVFIMFFDHGAPGLIAFPNSYLYADDLMDTLKFMHTNKLYSKLTLYIEACESGSMFDGKLPTDWNIYAVTAANPTESSWACDYDSSRNTYLSDCFSRNALVDFDNVDTDSETLAQQYELLKKLTTKSHVMKYGDLSFTNDMISEFVGKHTPSKAPRADDADAADSRDVKLVTLVKKFNAVADQNTLEAHDLEKEVQLEMLRRKHFDASFKALARLVYSSSGARARSFLPVSEVTDFTCYREAMANYEMHCGKLSDYGLKHARVLANMCNQGITAERIREAAVEICA